MRRFVVVLASVVAFGLIVPAVSSASYMYLSECRSALSGNPSTNDDDVTREINWAESYYGAQEYRQEWGDYYRYTDNRVHQNVRLFTWTGGWQYIRLTFECNDSNLSGQVSSAEDFVDSTKAIY